METRLAALTRRVYQLESGATPVPGRQFHSPAPQLLPDSGRSHGVGRPRPKPVKPGAGLGGGRRGKLAQPS